MEAQSIKISDAIPQHSNGSGTNQEITATLLPIDLENKEWKTPKSIEGLVCLECDIEAQLLETDDKMEAQLIKISDAIPQHSNGSGTNQEITATLLPIDLENKEWKTPKSIEGQVCLECDIEAQLLETDDKMEAQSIKISDAIPQHSNGSGTNQEITATLLPIDLENKEWKTPKSIEGQVCLECDIEAQLLETDDKMEAQSIKISDAIPQHSNGSGTNQEITATLLPIDLENKEWKTPKSIEGQVCLECDIEAQLLETDDKMEAQSIKISDAIPQHSNGSGTNQEITATLLPIDLETKGAYAIANSPTSEENTTTEESFSQAQTPVKYNLPVSVSLRQRINLRMSKYKNLLFITSCIKTGNTLVFTDTDNNRLIICNVDGTDIHHIPLPYKPYYMTMIDSNTVAVSYRYNWTIPIINISTRSVIRTIYTRTVFQGISYHENNLYFGIGKRTIQVMNLTDEVIRTISVPSRGIFDITVDRDRLVYTDIRSIYCYSLDGERIWVTAKDDNTENFRRVTTDNKGNVYATNTDTHTVEIIYDKGQQQRKLLNLSDGIYKPYGIFFDKEENILVVCSAKFGLVNLFDVKDK
ncbi:uncharacterized protein LOC134692913 [Mytilus trossulus]|uniref:uncharacterized protein LOC134692913 n=1 Tax=Mytilus trossulus TaxID=6551 RepID=UPI003007EBE3